MHELPHGFPFAQFFGFEALAEGADVPGAAAGALGAAAGACFASAGCDIADVDGSL